MNKKKATICTVMYAVLAVMLLCITLQIHTTFYLVVTSTLAFIFLADAIIRFYHWLLRG